MWISWNTDFAELCWESLALFRFMVYRNLFKFQSFSSFSLYNSYCT